MSSKALAKVFGAGVSKSIGSVVGSMQSVRVPGLFGFGRESFAGAWQQGVVVDDRQTMLSASPVYACINRISSDIAKLRIRLIERRDPLGTWLEVASSPFNELLVQPNAYQNRIQFFMAWMSSKLTFGNTYVLKVRDQRGIVVALHVLDPRLVQPLVTPEGDVYYRMGGDLLAGLKLASLTVPASEIIHDRGITLFHPLVGVSPIFACAMSATQRNKIQTNSAAFFANMSRPSGVITGPNIVTDEIAARIRDYWTTAYKDANTGKLAVLGDGMTYQPMTVNAVDSQLVAQLGWTDADIARAFDMPAYKIGVGPIPTNNNVAALNQQYYDGCLQIHIESIELLLDKGLGLPSRTATEFDLDGLLRMDPSTMAETLGKLSGIMTPDEQRARLNLPAIPGGDAVYLQQQEYSLAALAKRDARDDPFDTGAAQAQAKTMLETLERAAAAIRVRAARAEKAG